MSKAFAWVERVLVCLGIIALVLLVADLGGSAMLVAAGGLLAILYFVGGYFQAPKFSAQITGAGVALRVFSGVLFANAVIGLLFKLLFWTGADTMLWVGAVGAGVMAVLAYLLRERQADLSAVTNRGIVLAAVALAAAVTPSPALFGLLHRDNPALVEKYTDAYENPDDQALEADYRRAAQEDYNQQHAR